MADVHGFLNRVMTENRRFDWRHIAAALRELTEDEQPSSDTVELVRQLARLDRDVEVHDSTAPHAMSPTDMIRSHAVQALARWDASAHRDEIENVADTGSSDLLRAIARTHLP